MTVSQKKLISLLFWGVVSIQIPVAPVDAQSVFSAYNRPSDTSRRDGSQRRTISGSRGCERQSAQLTLLIPEDHIALTASEHPTFLFYLSDLPARPIRISIVDPQKPEPIFDRTLTINKAGLFSVTIPPTVSALENGKTYILTAGILCHPTRMSASAYISVNFQKIALNSYQQKKLERASTLLERAQIYAKEGIWYDALAASYEAVRVEDSGAVSYFQKLKAQINLQISQLEP